MLLTASETHAAMPISATSAALVSKFEISARKKMRENHRKNKTEDEKADMISYN